MASSESRIETARRRVRVARHSILAVAAAGFAVIGFAARDAHPATHTTGNSTDNTAAVGANDSETQSFSFDGGGSISPSSSFDTPSVQSGGS